jgi:dTMP kinase
MTESRGFFIVVDGPNGVGKSSVIDNLKEALLELNQKVYTTKEPTLSPLGCFIREGEDRYFGETLAYLIAADRAYHIASEIQPALDKGLIVISDRYVCSSLVLQRLDGLDIDFIWDLNKGFLIPDLTIILTTSKEELDKRLSDRNKFSRFERTKSRQEELDYFGQAAQFLTTKGFHVAIMKNNINITICVEEIKRLVQDLIFHPV